MVAYGKVMKVKRGHLICGRKEEEGRDNMEIQVVAIWIK